MNMTHYTIDGDLKLVVPNTSFANDVFNLTHQNFDALAKNLPWVNMIQSAEDCAAFLAEADHENRHHHTLFYFVIYRQQLIGMVSLNEISRHNKSASMGYWVIPEFQNKGITSKCAAAMMDIAFEKWQLNKLVIQTSTNNIASQRIAEKLHFSFEGVLQHNELIMHSPMDQRIYSMSQTDWKSFASPNTMTMS